MPPTSGAGLRKASWNTECFLLLYYLGSWPSFYSLMPLSEKARVPLHPLPHLPLLAKTSTLEITVEEMAFWEMWCITSYVIKMADGDRNSVGNGKDCDICVFYQPTDYRLGGRCWKASGIVELAWDESPWDVELSWENPPAGQQQNI